ncbi:MAG: tetratricopeptide repeat protein [bacterium]
MEITTTSPEAQKFFNQGLSLLHCFWWEEALRSFHEAARLDSACAMAYWGVYMVYSNSWNSGDSTAAAERKRARYRALAYSVSTSARERAYIQASHLLDSLDVKTWRVRYVQAMEDLIAQYPQEVEAKLLLSAFLFQDNFPHGYETEGQPSLFRRKCLALLEGLLQSHPEHAAVHHYRIHAIEGSPQPEAALESARKLAQLAPASGHMVHMPGHVYFRLGMYEQARASFLQSMKVDEAYMAAGQITPEQNWNYSHNLFYLAMNCAEDGRYQEGLKWAKLEGYPITMANFHLRYGMWAAAAQALQNAPEDEDNTASLQADKGFLAFLHGMADLEENKVVQARLQADTLDGALAQLLAAGSEQEDPYDALFGREVLTVYALELRGNIASAAGEHEHAIALLQQAVAKEKEVGYEEPPPYVRPALESLGRAYLRAGQWELAGAAYRDELALRPNSGHALFGIAQSYAHAGRHVEAAQAFESFLASWSYADEELQQMQEARRWLQTHESN